MKKFLCAVACMCCFSMPVIADDVDLDGEKYDFIYKFEDAAKANDLEKIKTLMSDINDNSAKQEILDQALIDACFVDGINLEIIKYLVVNGANVNKGKGTAMLPLEVASEKCRLDIVKYLVEEKHADVNFRDPASDFMSNGSTNIFYYAAVYGWCIDVARYLSEHGADVNVPDDYGMTPLVAVISELLRYRKDGTPYISDDGNKDKVFRVVEFLVKEAKVDVNLSDNNDSTALMRAVLAGNLDMVKVLVEDGGADINRKNKDGKTALDFTDKKEIIEYLKSRGAKSGDENGVHDKKNNDSGDDKTSDVDNRVDSDADKVDTRSDADKKLQELKDNAQKMKDKEQSAANKLLGGASIGAVGIGGMKIASGLAEQNADADAEEDMRAYLATFRCDYGAGRNIKGGEVGIELPGANDLTAPVSEYRALAADIAQRKTALDMAPGIEAEVIFDKSETGLYDNVGAGAQPGAFTSLSRALMDENSDDAKAWAAQKDATSKKLKTGAIVAGAGVVGSIAGNLIINNKNKNDSDKLLAEYQALKKLESDVNKLPKDGKVCRCENNQICNDNTGVCENCPGNKVVVNNKCTCPAGLPIEQANDTCVQKNTSVQWSCSPDSAKHIVADDINAGTCRCVDGYIPDNASRPTSCTCPGDTHEERVQGDTVQCITKTVIQNPEVVVPNVVKLDASSLFGTGLYTIKSGAAAKISEFAGSVKAQNKDKYCIKIVGNTDRTGSDKINIPLSKNRAIAVAKYLVDVNGLLVAHVCATGQGSINCTQDGSQESCRNVQMSYVADADCTASDCLPLSYVK